MNKFLFRIIFIGLCIIPKSVIPCTIFFAKSQSKILVAGNEDWSDPFTKIWVYQRSIDNYGVLFIGHSDFQAQFGINEYGLTVDYATIPKVEENEFKGKQNYEKDLFLEILSKCKTLKDAEIYLAKYRYPSSYHQAMISDASGNSAIVNGNGIFKNSYKYQIATNFNVSKKNDIIDCSRFKIVKETILASSDISVDLFTSILSLTHQEALNPTQYSYIVDHMKNELHLFSFHDFEHKVILDYKELIAKGFMLKDFKELFPSVFAEHEFRLNHKDSLKQSFVKRIQRNEGIAKVIADFEEMSTKDSTVADYPFLFIKVSMSILAEVLLTETNGKPFQYWWYPWEYFHLKTNDASLDKTLVLLDYLEKIPKENSRQNIGTFEFKGVLHKLLGNIDIAKEYFTKTLKISPKETGNYLRAKSFLEYLNSK